MFRFIHTADLHLDSPLRGLARYEGAPVGEIRGAARLALEKLVELAIEEQVAFVLIAGDLYDGSWKDHNTGLFFCQQMVRLREASVPVFIVSGNHDADSVVTTHLRMPDNVRQFSSRSPEIHLLEELGVAIHGQGYATRAVTTDLSEAYPDALAGQFNIGMLHTSITGRPGHEPYAPCTVDGLRSKAYDYWALGHVHEREVVAEDPWIVFPGNIQGRHARETGSKGCTLVTVEDGAVTSVEHRELDVLRWAVCEVDVTGAATGAEVLERVSDAFREELTGSAARTLAIRINLVGACGGHSELSGDPEHWRNEIRAAALDVGAERIWVEKVRFGTRGVVSVDDLAQQDDALGGLLRSIRDLEADDMRLGELVALFDDLRPKLPSGLTQGDDALDLKDLEVIRGAVADAKELLLARLLTAEGPK